MSNRMLLRMKSFLSELNVSYPLASLNHLPRNKNLIKFTLKLGVDLLLQEQSFQKQNLQFVLLQFNRVVLG